jgi:hypothetical protein
MRKKECANREFGSMKHQRKRIAAWRTVIGLAAILAIPASASAAPVIFTNQAAWSAAILSVDATATSGLEDFNGAAVTGGTGLGAGPHSYGGGDFSITLNNIGNGGSMTGVINPGEFDGTNAFEMRAVHDSSDFELFPGFFVQGEGFESLDGVFATSVLGFGADFNSTTTNDGLSIEVNGITIKLHDYYPDSTLADGDGFLGVVDSNGIGSFSIVADNQSPSDEFEQAEMDNFRWAHEGDDPGPGPGPGPGGAVPEPSAAILFSVGFFCIGLRKRGMR